MQLGTLISNNCSLHLDLQKLADKIQFSRLANSELLFYPDDPGEKLEDKTSGIGALAFFEDTPLAWSCTYGEFQVTARALGYKESLGDSKCFKNPTEAAVWFELGSPITKE